jgi:hypothetical protein
LPREKEKIYGKKKSKAEIASLGEGMAQEYKGN